MDDIIEEYYPSGKLESTVPSKDGKPHGHNKIYYETGELRYEGEFKNGKQEGLWKLYYENGDIKRENIFKNHKKISQKEFFTNNKIEFEGNYDENDDKTGKWCHYYKNGNLHKEEIFIKNVSQSLKEWDENGRLIKESISEILIINLGNNFYGDPIPDAIFGSEIYFKEWKDGNLITEEFLHEYKKPENIRAYDPALSSNIGVDKSEDEDSWWNWNREENKKYSSIKKYYDNGKLKMQSQFYTLPEFERHASNREEVNKYYIGPLKEYFPCGNLKCEGNYKDNQKDGIWIDYFKTGKVKSERIFKNDICESLKEWDEDGKIMNEKTLEEGEERTRLSHEIMTKGEWSLTLKNGTRINVYGQRHELREISEYYEDGEWIEGDSEIIDDFHLTGYEEGYLYEDEDLGKFFEIDEDTYPDWDFNGFSNDWCGIEEGDDYDTSKEKWDDYASQFPKVTSKDQFNIL